ncbi:MAG: rhomboid family intramembrane serine protease [Actinomycetota bacterium]
MIPLKDENPVSSTPVVTILLIAINIVVFLTEPLFASGQDAQFQEAKYFACRAAIPYEVTHGERIADARLRGVEFEDRIDNVFAEIERISCPQKNVWLSIFVSMFLHGSILHIAGNMLFLWVFGNNVEDRLGKGKFVAFYLLSGIAATYAQSYVFPSSATPLVGASGAIAGILGAYLLMFPRARIKSLVILVVFITMIELPASIVIGLWFVLQLVSSVGSVAADTGVAYMAHVGGFLAGMILLLIFRPRPASAMTHPY